MSEGFREKPWTVADARRWGYDARADETCVLCGSWAETKIRRVEGVLARTCATCEAGLERRQRRFDGGPDAA